MVGEEGCGQSPDSTREIGERKLQNWPGAVVWDPPWEGQVWVWLRLVTAGDQQTAAWIDTKTEAKGE